MSNGKHNYYQCPEKDLEAKIICKKPCTDKECDFNAMRTIYNWCLFYGEQWVHKKVCALCNQTKCAHHGGSVGSSDRTGNNMVLSHGGKVRGIKARKR